MRKELSSYQEDFERIVKEIEEGRIKNIELNYLEENPFFVVIDIISKDRRWTIKNIRRYIKKENKCKYFGTDKKDHPKILKYIGILRDLGYISSEQPEGGQRKKYYLTETGRKVHEAIKSTYPQIF